MKQRILFVLVVFVTFVLFFALQKPFFMWYNHALAGGISWVDYLYVIWHGKTLDFTIAGYFTIIPLLCALLSVWLPGRYLTAFLKGYFVVIAFLIALVFIADEALYEYWGFRLDSTVFFYMAQPKDAMASVPIWTLVIQLVTFVIYGFVMQWVFCKWIVPILPLTHLKKRAPSAIALLILGALMFIPIRGGVTTSTANVGMVYFSDNQFLNHSAINPCFSLITSLSKQQDFSKQYKYFTDEEAYSRFHSIMALSEAPADTLAATGTNLQELMPDSADLSSSPVLLKTKRPNILLILLESFTANAIEAVGGEPGVTPNLNSLAKEGVLFTNCYANSFRTDRGLVAVLNGYLAQPTTSIMKYPARSQTLPSIAKCLDSVGYVSDVLYGGDIDFTNMQSYFFSSGYSHIVSDRDFPIKTRLSKWGANDDVTFPRLLEDIKSREAGKPWFTTFLTLSSHEPFKVPYQRLEHPFLNSVAFTDSCIGDFISKLKTLPAWENTLIIFVADHGYRYPDNLDEHEPRRYHIPMIWMGGAIQSPRTIETYFSQTDLAATLLNQLDIPHNDFTYSKDIMNSRSPQFAFYTFNNGFGLIDTVGVSVYDCAGNRALIEQGEGASKRIEDGKALLQVLYDDLGKR